MLKDFYTLDYYLTEWKADSNEEVYFQWWLEELKSLGLIIDFKRGFKTEIIPQAWVLQTVPKPLKSNPYRVKLEERELLKSWDYEFDFEIEHNMDMVNVLFSIWGDINTDIKACPFVAQRDNDDLVSYVDVKPSFMGRNNTTSTKFPLIQKAMFCWHELYINKTIPLGPKGLFSATFTPERYLYQDRNNKPRRISQWKPISIMEFLKTKKV